MVGAVSGLAFSLWLSIGSGFAQTYDPPLPSPTSGCWPTNDTVFYSTIDTVFSNSTLQVSTVSSIYMQNETTHDTERYDV